MLSKTALVITLLAATTYGQGRIAQGPFVGHLAQDSVSIWARLSEPGSYSLVLTDGSARDPLTVSQTAHPDRDLCPLRN